MYLRGGEDGLLYRQIELALTTHTKIITDEDLT